jgi:hypothetical protein
MTRWTAAVLGTLVLAATGVGQEKPEAVVNKAIEAHGGLATLKKFPAAKSEASGKMYVPGAEIPFTAVSSVFPPGRSRLEMNMDLPDGRKVAVVQVVNGDEVKQSENGKDLPLGDEVKTHARQSAKWHEAMQLYPLLDADRFTLTTGKDATLGGKKFAVVTVKSKGLPDTTLYFDRATGRLTHTRRATLNFSRQQVVEFTTRSDFKTIDGLVVAMKTVTTHNGKPYLESTTTSFTPLEKIDDAAFDTK